MMPFHGKKTRIQLYTRFFNVESDYVLNFPGVMPIMRLKALQKQL